MMDNRWQTAGGAKCGCSGRQAQNAEKSAGTNNMCSVCSTAARSENTVMEQVPVMVYIVTQPWGNVYLPCRALAQGTLFPALDKPFFGKGGCCND